MVLGLRLYGDEYILEGLYVTYIYIYIRHAYIHTTVLFICVLVVLYLELI